MKAVVTGASGMLARAVVAEMLREGWKVAAPDRRALDVTEPIAVRRFLDREMPDVVLQGAAYTDVDGAERDEASAHRINVDGTAHVASECQRIGALFVYPSTDYLFSTIVDRPIRPDDPPSPLNTYGWTKLRGEEVAREAGRFQILRTSWLFGAGGRNFVDTILRKGRTVPSVEVVDDQIGRPTWSRSLASTIVRLIGTGANGTFHATGGGPPVARYGLALYALEIAGLPTRVIPVKSEALACVAQRPAYSVLDCSETEALVGKPMPDWRDCVLDYLRERTVAATG